MNDEATAHYSQIIDDFTIGHRWLRHNFGKCGVPRVGWQIDPFGHSRQQASISAMNGFDGLFLGRIDFQDKKQRERTKTMEFVWHGSPSLGPKTDIFTGVLPNVYWPPTGFCWDVNCFDEPVYAENAMKKARDFIQMAKKQAKTYATNHTVITMGMDFYYRNAAKWFYNLDRLMAAVNSLQAQEGVNVIYSTPSCYLKALHESNFLWPEKNDDFFPYADDWDVYWTGYFSSRPSLKYYIQYGNNILQLAKQITVLGRTNKAINDMILPLEEVMGILQHHDAVTGRVFHG